MGTSLCSAQDAGSSLQNFFEAARKGTYLPAEKATTNEKGEKITLHALRPYLLDSVPVIRAKAYEITFAISFASADTDVRGRGVETLMNACGEDEVANAALAIGLLARFNTNDFTTASKDSLRRFIRDAQAPLDQLMKLAGFLQLRDLMPAMRPRTQPGTPPSLRWAALLALARLGDDAAVADITKRVARLPVNDDVVYRLFPDLIYTRQPQPIAYVVAALMSDEKNCMSADAEREVPIPCGYRIMEMLAPAIAHYPLELGTTGDIETDDYSGALAKVREWFTHNKQYAILNDRY